MDALIALALRKTRIQLNDEFHYLELEHHFDNQIELPNNLIIDYYE
jgi:hypothetical protein